MTESRRPLDGVKCICITTAQQGTVVFAHMADLGAEVIKIEPPGTGELVRHLAGNNSDSWLIGYHETNNRGVKGVTLNTRHEKGR